MPLRERLAVNRVTVLIKSPEHGDKSLFVIPHGFKRRQLQCAFRHFLCLVSQPADLFHRQSLGKCESEFQYRLFSHSINQIVRLGIKKDRAADLVVPEIIMCHAAQRSLDTAEHDRFCILEVPADQVGVDHAGTVRTAVVDPAGRIIIAFAGLFGSGIIRHHRIHRTGGYAPEELRLAQTGDISRGIHIRLGDNCRVVTGILQHMTDHSDPDVRRIDIGIPRHQDHVRRVPAEYFYFVNRCW